MPISSFLIALILYALLKEVHVDQISNVLLNVHNYFIKTNGLLIIFFWSLPLKFKFSTITYVFPPRDITLLVVYTLRSPSY